jgi:hypothetical protein
MAAGSDAAPTTVASGDRAIAVGGDAINSLLVTGDNNTFFIGRYERLVDAYLDPRVLYAELDLQAFTGRDWLVAAVDRFLATHDRGYLVLEAEAGMGKSTFLAWLARERGYVHHFVRLMPDPQDVAVAIKNLGVQLIRQWDLEGYAIGGVLPPSAGRPAFLRELLDDAASRRDQLRPGEPIVLVVDGLNETVPVAGHNPLGLPASLPAGVYVVASQRPVQVPLRVDVARVVLEIEAQGEENMRDAREYLNHVAVSPAVRQQLQAAGLSREAFVDVLLAKSGGVWIYLHYIVAEIERGGRSPRELDRLPIGLWQYYGQYWHEWQRAHAERWPEVDLPLLAVVAAAAEPLPAALLAALAGIRNTAVVEALLEDDWRPFIQVQEVADEVRYQTFHDSLKEFLHGEVDVGQLTAAERSLARRLARATTEAHGRVADRYLDGWGGLSQGLPALRTGELTELGDYGLRHVVEHLDRAGRPDDLHAVMTASWAEGGRRANAWFRVHRRTGELAAYRRDLGTAWNATQRHSGNLRHALQLRYALMLCSLNSQAATTPPALWAILLRQGRLTAEESLTQVRQIPDAVERAEALTSLIGVVPERLRDRVEREALAAVRAVPDGYWRVSELWRLHGRISAGLRQELLVIAASIAKPYDRAVAFRLLGVEQEPVELTPAPDAAGERDVSSPTGLAGSTDFVDAYLRRRAFAADLLRRAGLDAVGGGGDAVARYWRAQLLLASGTDAAADERALAAAVALSEHIGDGDPVTAAWAVLGDALPPEAPLGELAARIADPGSRAVFLLHARARSRGSGGDADRLAAQALGEVAGDERVAAVVVQARAALAGDLDQLLRLATAIAGVERRAAALLAAAPLAAPADAERIGAEATAPLLEAAPVSPAVAGLLARGVPFLPATALGAVLAWAGRLADGDVRAALHAAVGMRWCELGQPQQAAALLEHASGLPRALLARALARAHARAGAPREAVRLAGGLPYAPWRSEVLALAAHRLDGSGADAAVGEATAIAERLDAPSRVSVIARALAVAPTRYQPALRAAATAAAEGVGHQPERSRALFAVVEALLAQGDARGALALAAGIPVERSRADALGAVLGSGDPDAVRGAAELVGALEDPDSRGPLRVLVLRGLRAAGATGGAGGGPAGDSELDRALGLALGDMVSRSRGELLECLRDLVPVVVLLDGAQAAATVATDLADVVEWWP